jgi:hypothetical protein
MVWNPMGNFLWPATDILFVQENDCGASHRKVRINEFFKRGYDIFQIQGVERHF